MTAIGVVLGEVISMGILFRLTSDMQPWLAFATCGGVGLIFSFCFLFMITEPQLRGGQKKQETAVVLTADLMSPFTPSRSKNIDMPYDGF